MIDRSGIHLHMPRATIPWEASSAGYAAVLGDDPDQQLATRRAVTSTEHAIAPAELLPGVTGTLRVRLAPDGAELRLVEGVLYMGRGWTTPDSPVTAALVRALGPGEHVPAVREGDAAHSDLRRWVVGPVVVSHGWFLEYDVRTEWDEEEVRIQRSDRPASWRR